MILLDTSVLIDSFTGPMGSRAAFRRALESGERLAIPSLVLYEWLRGPRRPEELYAQEQLLPKAHAVPFGVREAAAAADLYGRVSRARRREFDLAIAACAIIRGATLWTLNLADFRDIPGLRVARPG